MSTDPSVLMLSKLTGLSVDELEWTWRRTKYLIQEQGMRPHLAKKLVKKEAEDRPWAKLIYID